MFFSGGNVRTRHRNGVFFPLRIAPSFYLNACDVSWNPSSTSQFPRRHRGPERGGGGGVAWIFSCPNHHNNPKVFTGFSLQRPKWEGNKITHSSVPLCGLFFFKKGADFGSPKDHGWPCNGFGWVNEPVLLRRGCWLAGPQNDAERPLRGKSDP